MAQLNSTKIYGDLIVTGITSSDNLLESSIICFDVASSTSIAAGNTQTFNTVYLNKGNGFNTSNSRFTAPVAGIYIFYYTTIKSTNSTAVGRFLLKLNGSILYGNRRLRLDENGAYGDNGVVSWIVSMQKNDYVEVFVSAGASYAGVAYNYFNGFKVG